MSKIGVIIPVYHVESYLQRCIDSVLNQTYTDFEVVLVDDGSPDECGAICDDYAKKDKRIHVIHQKNAGLSAARNAGLDWLFSNSTCEWISFIDSDDWVHEKYLEALLDAVSRYNVKVSICSYERTNGEDITVKDESLKVQEWDTESFYVENRVNAIIAWGKLYDKECFRYIRYPVGKIHEDEFVTYRILYVQPKVAVVEEPLYAYFQNPNGIMLSQWMPKRLSIIEALETQMNYFTNGDYRKRQEYMESGKEVELVQYDWIKADAVTRKLYMGILGMCLKKLNSCDIETQKKYTHRVRLKLRKALIIYHKQRPFRANEWLYDAAFPRIMVGYWKVKSIAKVVVGHIRN
jgi:glycosyltransferase involved in cell wall biosynthesis